MARPRKEEPRLDLDEGWLDLLAEIVAERAAEAAQAADSVAAEQTEQGVPMEQRIAAMRAECAGNPKQMAMGKDPSRMLCVQGTRRSGKSSFWNRELCAFGLEHPGSHQLYINTTRKEAKRICWRGANKKDGIFSLNERYDLGYEARVGDLQFAHPNGSIIDLVGADDEAAVDRALGGAYHRAVFDESQKMLWLKRAMEVFGPAMMDFRGQIVLLGSPDRLFAGLYYEITNGKLAKSRWSIHKLSILDNPHFGKTEAERYQVILDYCEEHGLTVDDPQVRRAWFNEWATEDALFVYDVHKVPEHTLCYAEPRWTTIEIPQPDGKSFEAVEWPDFYAALEDLPRRADGSHKSWNIGVGADLGYDPDPFGLVVGCWSEEDPCLYELGSWKMPKLIPDQQVWLLQRVRELLHPQFMVGDAGGGGKLVVKGWEHGWLDRAPLPIQAAEKHNKATFQEFLNNDIRTGRCKLRRGSPLHKEMQELPKLIGPTGKVIENVARGEGGGKRHPNDCTDPWLYFHREARHHRYVDGTERPGKAPKGSEEYLQEVEARLEEAALAEIEENDDALWQ